MGVGPSNTLTRILDFLVAEDLTDAPIGLFKNDATLTEATVLADLTEADFVGYARGQCQNWTSAVYNAAGKGEITADLVTFECSSSGTPNTIYGFFVLDGNGDLFYAEKNQSGGQSISNPGDKYDVIPAFTMDNES